MPLNNFRSLDHPNKYYSANWVKRGAILKITILENEQNRIIDNAQ